MLATALVWLSVTGCTDIATGGADGRARYQFDTLELSHVKVPTDLSFCGERVPIEIPEVYERAERELLLNLQSPGQIMLYLKRSGRYFPMYERVLKEERMPDDLKYVSVAESALFMARSAKDAVGLWQFIAPTAKSVGLIVDEYVDERRHPESISATATKPTARGPTPSPATTWATRTSTTTSDSKDLRTTTISTSTKRPRGMSCALP
jgi:hypothetical protein